MGLRVGATKNFSICESPASISPLREAPFRMELLGLQTKFIPPQMNRKLEPGFEIANLIPTKIISLFSAAALLSLPSIVSISADRSKNCADRSNNDCFCDTDDHNVNICEKVDTDRPPTKPTQRFGDSDQRISTDLKTSSTTEATRRWPWYSRHPQPNKRPTFGDDRWSLVLGLVLTISIDPNLPDIRRNNGTFLRPQSDVVMGAPATVWRQDLLN